MYFLLVLVGSRYGTPKMMDLCKIAVETCFWPLYEIENGKYKITYMPKEKRPITDWIEAQGRLKHILKNEEAIKIIQADVDAQWGRITRPCSTLKNNRL